MRYILTGAQSVGKSVLLRHFSEKMNTITEVVRNLAKNEGINVNENGDFEGQSRIFNTYKNLFETTPGPFISDRGLTDVISYTCYNMKDKGVEGEKFLENQVNELLKFQEENPDVVYFYVPIEFNVVDDGFRSLNEDFRKEIDKNIKDLLDAYNIDYYTITGTVEERLDTIKEIMKNYGDYYE